MLAGVNKDYGDDTGNEWEMLESHVDSGLMVSKTQKTTYAL